VTVLWAAALLCAVALTATAFALLVLLKPAVNLRSASIGTSARLGDVTYTSPGARPLDPRNRDDAMLLRGAGDPVSHSRDIWFGAFVDATNDGARPAATARHVTLRDIDGVRFEPVALPAANRFRYRARSIPPRGEVPGQSSAADSDLAAEGDLLLFRIPRSAYEAGPLELRFTQGGHSEDLAVSDGGGAHLSS
jgi:hypothetical protein